MDIGEHIVVLPALSDINEQVDSLIRRTINARLEALILAIAEGEKLSHKYLIDKYLPDASLSHVSSEASVAPSQAGDQSTSKFHRRIPEDSDRCLAKISNGNRCTRKRRDERFCGSHATSRKYGEITDV
jgi:hypothetical protein